MTESKEIMKKEISNEADLKLEFTKEGNVKFEVVYAGKGATAGTYLEMKSEYFLDKLKEAIPGEVDDKIIDMLKVAFKIV